MKIKKRELNNLIKKYLTENDGLYPDSDLNVGATAADRYRNSQISRSRQYSDYETVDADIAGRKIPVLKQNKYSKFKDPKDAFYNGQDVYSIPELCLLWYQNLGKGKDLKMFGEGGVFNNHPDADAFKAEISNVLKERFKNDSFNIIHPETNQLLNATTISADNTYGSSYNAANIVRVLLAIQMGSNKNMLDHLMVTIGQAGSGGRQLLEKPDRIDEVILNPRHDIKNTSYLKRKSGTILFKNRYDFSKFAIIADRVTLSSRYTSQNLDSYDVSPVPFDLIIELDNQYNIPIDMSAPLSKSGLETGNEMYNLANENKTKIGDVVK